MITARNFSLDDHGSQAQLRCEIRGADLPGELWFRTPSGNAADLCHDDQSWAALALLWPAMVAGEDLTIEGMMPGSLLHALNTDVQALLRVFVPQLNRITVRAAEAPPAPGRIGVAATAYSGGVDSFYTLALYGGDSAPKDLRITALTNFNVGRPSQTEAALRLFRAAADRTTEIAARKGLRPIVVDSNLDLVYEALRPRGEIRYLKTHTLRHAAAAAAASGLVSVYHYASTYPYQSLRLKGSYYGGNLDPILLPLLSSPRLSFRSAGAGVSRIEKFGIISEQEDPRRYLDVCMADKEERARLSVPNCSKCSKCCRAMLTLECYGRLDDFNQVFDVADYRAHRMARLQKLARAAVHGDPSAQDIRAFARQRGLSMPRGETALGWTVRRLSRGTLRRLKSRLKGS